MSNKVFKNYQINLGLPFQVKVPFDDGESGTVLNVPEGWAPQRIAGPDGGDLFNGGGPGAAVRIDGAEYVLDENGVFTGVGEEGERIELSPEAAAAIIIDKARAEAERIIQEAKDRSDGVISAAKAEADGFYNASRREAEGFFNSVMEQASLEASEMREQAVAEGGEEGRAEGKAEYDGLIGEALRIRSEAEEEYKRLLTGAEGDALELVLEVAKKAVGEEMEMNRKNLLYMIKDAFMHCSNKENVVLKVSADDFNYISMNRDALLSMTEGVDKLDIKRDLSLAQGSCYIETPFGNLDAGVSTRIAKIESAFHRILSTVGPSNE